MRSPPLARSLQTLILLLCPGLFGCGQSAQDRLDQALPDRAAVSPVPGSIVVDDVEEGPLLVRLVPQGDLKPAPNNPICFTKEDGTFKFTTYLEGDGVPLGEYRVLVEWLTKDGPTGWIGPDKLKNRYNHLEEPVETVTVEAGEPLTDLKFELRLADQPIKKSPTYGVTHLGKPVKSRGVRR